MLADIWDGLVGAFGSSGAGADAAAGAASGWGSALGSLGSIARVATPIVGAIMGTSANNSAGRSMAGATRDAAQLQTDALLRSMDFIRAGSEDYARTIAPILEERAVTLPTYRGLTAAEQIGRDDVRRGALSTLAASGLRGAGRAGIATVMDADRRFVTSAVDRNDDRRLSAAQAARASADSARRGLAGVYGNQGQVLSGIEGSIGGVQAQGALSQGQIDAGRTTANANLVGDALGTLGAVLAGAGKEANRERYAANERVV